MAAAEQLMWRRVKFVNRSLTLALAAALTGCQVTAPLAPNTGPKDYEKEVIRRMGVVWTRLSAQHIDLLAPGTIKLRFKVERDGRISNLKIVSNSGNETLADVATRTVEETRVPPIPPATLVTLPDGYIPSDVDFTVVAAREQNQQ